MMVFLVECGLLVSPEVFCLLINDFFRFYLLNLFSKWFH